MLNANQIKVRLIDLLLEHDCPDLIASEVSFYSGFRKADIVSLGNDKITAFEIKSDRDNLVNVAEQLTDYANTFSFCYLVTTEKHMAAVRQLLPKKIGLIIASKENMRVIRKPAENRQLCKHSLTLGIPERIIASLIRTSTSNFNVVDTRNAGQTKLSTETLRQRFYSTVHQKYARKYENFLKDRGSLTTLTDLFYLQHS